jgi:hypothetical protein
MSVNKKVTVPLGNGLRSAIASDKDAPKKRDRTRAGFKYFQLTRRRGLFDQGPLLDRCTPKRQRAIAQGRFFAALDHWSQILKTGVVGTE